MPSCCGRSFNLNGYRNHIAHSAMHADDHECNYCDDTFRWEEDRDKHEQKEHWHHCQNCNWRFKFRTDLDRHIQAEHPFECDICDKRFAQVSSLTQHMNAADDHQNYCYKCKRSFTSPNALNMHLKSSTHVGKNAKCPWCPNKFTNLTGITLHLESGKCPSGIDRQKIDNYCRQVDRDHVFTKRLIEYPTRESYEPAAATSTAWNSRRQCYACYFCSRGFPNLIALNQHLNSPVHQQKIYHCFRCKLEYVALSALVNHLESEACGPFRAQAMTGSLRTVANRFLITQ